MNTFENIYKTNYKTVFRFARKLLNDSNLASDISQEVFIDLYNKKTNDIKSIKSWLFRVTANKCFDYHKKASIEHQLTSNTEELLATEEYEDEAKHKIVNNAISKLNERDKLLVVLYSENISYKEIAEIAGMNVNSIGKTLSRALKKLEEELKPVYHELFA